MLIINETTQELASGGHKQLQDHSDFVLTRAHVKQA
jgi:hypothetical protein